MTASLQPGSAISHYRVIGPLGSGGMGEVYRARDESLGRDVALKILPAALVHNEERLRRFVLEARSASSLNHPNIVTIYEIGKDRVRSENRSVTQSGTRAGAPANDGSGAAYGSGGVSDASGPSTEREGGAAPVHFISMELVSGETVAAKIHREKADLRTLLGWLAQAADGLAKAHGAGIIHRDLKPGNIMVSNDGFAKVLDFGLAKLTERRRPGAASGYAGVRDSPGAGVPDATADPLAAEAGPRGGALSAVDEDSDPANTLTETVARTDEGVVLGTAGYMSPEQVQGKPVDHRSDIFSFGCILYEAATRTRPFVAESAVETMHKILREAPVPVEELNAQAPAELRRLIRRCLAKDPNQRLDSMKSLALELREIVDEYDALSVSSASGSGASTAVGVMGAATTTPARRHRALLAMVAAAAALVVIAGIVVGLREVRTGAPGTPSPSMRMTVVRSLERPFSQMTALSREGRFLAYVSAGGLWVRQVATGTDMQVVPPSDLSWDSTPNFPNFSPDGNYLFFTRSDPELAGSQALFEVPSMGGAPRKRAFNVGQGFTFAPDGRRVCFARDFPQKHSSSLIVLDLENGQERTLATVATPVYFRAAPSWSWNGGKIAAVEAGPGVEARLVAFRADDGRRETLVSDRAFRPWQIAWLPDGSGLVVTGVEGPLGPSQVWLVPYPDGRPRMITAGEGAYGGVSVSSDGKTLASSRWEARGDFWTAETAAGRAVVRRLTSERRMGWAEFDTAKDGSVVFVDLKERFPLWTMGADGSGRRPITSVSAQWVRLRCLPDGGLILALTGEDRIPHLWRMDAGGSNLRQLTSGSGEWMVNVFPDGGKVLFYPAAHPDELWALPEGGGAVKMATPFDSSALFSPDGDRIAYNSARESGGRTRLVWNIIPAVGGAPVASLLLPTDARNVRWAPDGKSLTFVDGANVFRQRLDGGKPEALTRFTGGEIEAHQWSPDGRRLLLRRRIGDLDNLWIAAADGGDPAPWTDFKTGSIFDMTWARDGRRVVFTYGESGGDVLLIRDFR